MNHYRGIRKVTFSCSKQAVQNNGRTCKKRQIKENRTPIQTLMVSQETHRAICVTWEDTCCVVTDLSKPVIGQVMPKSYSCQTVSLINESTSAMSSAKKIDNLICWDFFSWPIAFVNVKLSATCFSLDSLHYSAILLHYSGMSHCSFFFITRC